MSAALLKSKSLVSCSRYVASGIEEGISPSEAPEHRPGRKMLSWLAAPDRRPPTLVCIDGERAGRKIGQQVQLRAVAHPPASRQQAVIIGMCVAERRAGESR